MLGYDNTLALQGVPVWPWSFLESFSTSYDWQLGITEAGPSGHRFQYYAAESGTERGPAGTLQAWPGTFPVSVQFPPNRWSDSGLHREVLAFIAWCAVNSGGYFIRYRPEVLARCGIETVDMTGRMALGRQVLQIASKASVEGMPTYVYGLRKLDFLGPRGIELTDADPDGPGAAAAPFSSDPTAEPTWAGEDLYGLVHGVGSGGALVSIYEIPVHSAKDYKQLWSVAQGNRIAFIRSGATIFTGKLNSAAATLIGTPPYAKWNLSFLDGFSAGGAPQAGDFVSDTAIAA